jgi:hypothetical protein
VLNRKLVFEVTGDEGRKRDGDGDNDVGKAGKRHKGQVLVDDFASPGKITSAWRIIRSKLALRKYPLPNSPQPGGNDLEEGARCALPHERR